MPPLVVLLLLPALLALAPQTPRCDTAARCREAALAAAAEGDVERFHDLAWRVLQTGRPNDPEAMLLLARAQSLSGRPGDALVMLRRLAERGIAPDVAEDEDFRRVRALPGWQDVAERLARAREARTAAPAPAGETTAEVSRAAAARPSAPAAARDSAPAAPAAVSPPAAAPKATPPASVSRADPPPAPVRRADPPAARAAAAAAIEAAPLPAGLTQVAGLGYDRVSRRFVIGDAANNRLVVADEVFKRVNDLIRAGRAEFGTISSLAIDPGRGDLWVAASDGSDGTTLHKLQLVSGRVLTSVPLPAEGAPSAIVDMAIEANGTIVLLDSRDPRLVMVEPAGTRLTRATVVPREPRSLALAAGSAYVAHRGGLFLLDRRGGTGHDVEPADEVDLSGLARIRAHRGSVLAIQATSAGARLVRIRLDRAGRRAASLDVLDDDVPPEAAALTVSGDVAFYVGRVDGVPAIKRLPLR